MDRLTADQTAASSSSPVRIRTTRSTLVTKILPSPILPVRAARTISSTQRSTSSSFTTTSTFTLGRKSTTYSAPRYSSVWPFWRPKPFTSVTVMPCTPMPESDSRTSSSLKGLMMAVTSFMLAPWEGRGSEVVRVLGPKHRRRLAQVLAVDRARVRVRVGVDVGERGAEAVAEVLAEGDRPVGIGGAVVALDLLVADVGSDGETPEAGLEGGAQVDVVAVLAVGEAEQVGDRMRVLQRGGTPGAGG